MKSTEKQELKRRIKRLFMFLGIVLVPCLVVCVLLIYAKIPQWLNILVLVIMLFILYSVYVVLCNKLDQKKKVRMSKKKDPFSD